MALRVQREMKRLHGRSGESCGEAVMQAAKRYCGAAGRVNLARGGCPSGDDPFCNPIVPVKWASATKWANCAYKGSRG
jgi:hypothetical protein